MYLKVKKDDETIIVYQVVSIRYDIKKDIIEFLGTRDSDMVRIHHAGYDMMELQKFIISNNIILLEDLLMIFEVTQVEVI